MAQKASRRKEIVAEKRKAEMATIGGHEARQVIEAAQAPIESSVVTDDLFGLGIGWVALARRLRSGQIGASFFLVDVWCLGIKDAFFAVMSREMFEERMEASGYDQQFVDIDPSVARKLLHDAAAYAMSLGLSPSDRFTDAEAIFGDIAMASDTFAFGKDGKPFFVSGPNDSPTRIRRVLDTLAKRAGPNDFDYIVEVGDVASAADVDELEFVSADDAERVQGD